MWMFLKSISLGTALMALATVLSAQSEYRVQTGDVLSIEVLQDSSLNRTVTVLPDGRFNFPLAGTIRASGQNSTQIEQAISTSIASNFSTPPNVFVSIQPAERPAVQSRSAAPVTIDVYFIGEVNSPGTVAVQPGTTVLQALAIGGGVSRFAAIKRIQLRRTDPQTRQQNVYTINYKALSNGAAGTDIELRDGDVILVPERRLFE